MLVDGPAALPANLLLPMLEDLLACEPSIVHRIDFPEGEQGLSALLRGEITMLPRADFVHVYGMCTRLLEQVARRHRSQGGNREKALEAFLSYVLTADTLGDACRRAIDFNEFLEERGYSLSLDTVGTTAFFKLDLKPLVERAPPSLMVANILFYHNILSWLAAEPIDLLEIGLTLPAPCSGSAGIDVLDAPVRYGRTESYLAFQRHNLDRRVLQSRRDLDGIVELIAYDPLLFMRGHRSMAIQIRSWLRDLSLNERCLPDSGATARHFRISPSTLSRRLREEGTSFLTVKSECQQDIAKTLLHEDDRSIAEIALRLGFLRCAKLQTGLREMDRHAAFRFPAAVVAFRERINRDVTASRRTGIDLKCPHMGEIKLSSPHPQSSIFPASIGRFIRTRSQP